MFDGKTEAISRRCRIPASMSVNGLDAMGEILIPKISVDMPILHGAGQDVLEHAAGHLAGTSLPIGGKNTRAVITGHSNLKGATLFTRLGDSKTATRSISRSWVTRSPIESPANASSLLPTRNRCVSIRGRTRSRSSPVRAGQYAATACHGGAQQHARSGPLARRCHGGRKKGGFCFGRHRDGDIGCRIFALSQSACRGSSYRFATDT